MSRVPFDAMVAALFLFDLSSTSWSFPSRVLILFSRESYICFDAWMIRWSIYLFKDDVSSSLASSEAILTSFKAVRRNTSRSDIMITRKNSSVKFLLFYDQRNKLQLSMNL